ncbi:MAG: hypothetical protein WCS30_11620 [Selenomonadaceae bacterium]
MKAIYKKILDLYKTKNLFYTITSLSPEIGKKRVLNSEQLEELSIDIKAENCLLQLISQEKAILSKI